ncbi:unnamed protein product [Protopolystoma xenopodis]|uniref:Uncharacterized protein n=1 Tax=Protopolystoma xenopodis TaxID=117903 RepID=A0A3S5BJS3_9PLAT|nr:unnamed protein product [Protopolystoma xenopodis]
MKSFFKFHTIILRPTSAFRLRNLSAEDSFGNASTCAPQAMGICVGGKTLVASVSKAATGCPHARVSYVPMSVVGPFGTADTRIIIEGGRYTTNVANLMLILTYTSINT